MILCLSWSQARPGSSLPIGRCLCLFCTIQLPALTPLPCYVTVRICGGVHFLLAPVSPPLKIYLEILARVSKGKLEKWRRRRGKNEDRRRSETRGRECNAIWKTGWILGSRQYKLWSIITACCGIVLDPNAAMLLS